MLIGVEDRRQQVHVLGVPRPGLPVHDFLDIGRRIAELTENPEIADASTSVPIPPVHSVIPCSFRVFRFLFVPFVLQPPSDYTPFPQARQTMEYSPHVW
jgi:hypothetical protein